MKQLAKDWCKLDVNNTTALMKVSKQIFPICSSRVKALTREPNIIHVGKKSVKAAVLNG